MKFNVEIYQADYIKGGPVPYHEKFVREKDFLAALAERDTEIKRLREVLVKIRGRGGDCDCIRTLCPVYLAKEALEKGEL